MSEVTSQFPEILPVVEAYLEDCKKTGKPMRVHFWDTHHGTAAPADAIADKGLYELASRYGNPHYIIEEFGAAKMTDLANKYIHGDQNSYEEAVAFLENLAKSDHKAKSIIDTLELIKKKGGNVLFPDPREASTNERMEKLPEAEKAILEKFGRFLNIETERRRNAGKSTNFANLLLDDPNIEKRIKDFFTPDEYQFLVEKMQRRTLPNTTKTDKKISETVASSVKDGDVQLIIYGAAHYTKNNDLDDLMPGLNIAIIDSAKSNVLQNIYADPEERKLHHSLPDYVLYADQHKMVKLDNDKAKAEFMGISEEEFRSWKRTIEMLDKPDRLAAR